MPKRFVLALAASVLLASPGRSSEQEIFSRAARTDELPNGLKIVTIPVQPSKVVSYYTIVRSGSRNEVEPGASGFARFFEHMMFNGTRRIPRADYDAFLTRLGAGTNVIATDDFTAYGIVFTNADSLADVIKTEADRVINVESTKDMLPAEGRTIEGENSAAVPNPDRRLFELLRATAFDKHPYRHAAPGSLTDFHDLSRRHADSLLYKKRFYAPDNTILLIAGDINRDELLPLLRNSYGGWEASNFTLQAPAEPPQSRPKRAHIEWPAKTLARLAVAFHGPAYSDKVIDKAALDLLASAAFSSSSPLHHKLVLEEGACLSLGASFPNTREPSLFVVNAVVKNDDDVAGVEGAILKELERLKLELLPARTLAEIMSNLKYAVADALSTTDGMAGTVAFYLGLTGDPGTINRLFNLYDKVTARDIQDMAKKYFRPENATVVTLKGGKAK